MSVRRVVLQEPGTVRICEAEVPRAGDGHALVRLRVAGICGSDLSAYRGTSALVSYPRVIGHEVLVDVLFSPERPQIEGSRAVLDPMLPCRECHACRAGRFNCCARLQVMGVHTDGGLQELWTVPVRNLYPVPASMPDETAVLAEPFTIAYHAVQRSGVEAGSLALVFGAGAIGLLISSLLLRGRGCRVLVVDPDEQRLRVAESLGTTPLLADDALVDRVAEASGGDMADVVFEASGSTAATQRTVATVAHAGRIVLVGWNSRPVELDTVTLMRKEVDLLGSRNSFNAFPSVIRLLEDGVVDPQVLITHRLGFEETGSALALLDSGDGNALKVLIHTQ